MRRLFESTALQEREYFNEIPVSLNTLQLNINFKNPSLTKINSLYA